MGRTLHYTMHPNHSVTVTEGDWEKVETITDYFNHNFKWTCEDVGFNNLSYYPRWLNRFPDSKLKEAPTEVLWRFLDAEYVKLKEKGLSRFAIIRDLHKRKFIAFYNDSDCLELQKAHGFTKVAGNEWNALLVVAWLTAVSTMLPHHDFELHDEGKLLKVDIFMKDGRAKPDIMRELERIKWFSTEINKGNKEFVEFRDENRAVFDEFKDVGWKPPAFFCRTIDPRDFEQHPEFGTTVLSVDNGSVSGTGAHVMDGFHGEYFGFISETEAKLNSRKAFENIVKIILKPKEAA